jgi:hypothetical protein
MAYLFELKTLVLKLFLVGIGYELLRLALSD